MTDQVPAAQVIRVSRPMRQETVPLLPSVAAGPRVSMQQRQSSPSLVFDLGFIFFFV